MTRYRMIDTGASRSFPVRHALHEAAASDGADADDSLGLILAGAGAGAAFGRLGDIGRQAFVAIELDTECLGVHAGEGRDERRANVLGFARFRLGDAEPTALVELVRQPWTTPQALDAARQAFEASGLTVAVCNDRPGRIVNRLIRPVYNAVLRRLDERLATADEIDKTLRLGLGYPEGPLALLERTGLADHARVTEALYRALGDPAYAPARAAQVALERTRRREPRG
jgi:3-hydroxybutyryl-CoA dehydrogenase